MDAAIGGCHEVAAVRCRTEKMDRMVKYEKGFKFTLIAG
jgi:hypothetical protein